MSREGVEGNEKDDTDVKRFLRSPVRSGEKQRREKRKELKGEKPQRRGQPKIFSIQTRGRCKIRTGQVVCQVKEPRGQVSLRPDSNHGSAGGPRNPPGGEHTVGGIKLTTGGG